MAKQVQKMKGSKKSKGTAGRRRAQTVSNSAAPRKTGRTSFLKRQQLGGSNVDRSIAQEARGEENALMQTLYDPCHAELKHGPYRGPHGFINRFQSQLTPALAATETGTVFVWVPSSGVYSIASFTNTGVNTPISLTTTLSPGSVFYGANANQTRCLGACVQAWSNLAPLNVTGNIAMGTIPYSQIATVATVSKLIDSCTFKGKLTSDCYEQKWYPAMADEMYSQYNTAPTTDAAGDVNALVIVVYGAPVSSTWTLSLTAITEWTPQATIGLQTPTTCSVSRVSPSEVVAKLNRIKPNWYTRVGNIISSALPYVVAGTELAAGVAGLLL